MSDPVTTDSLELQDQLHLSDAVLSAQPTDSGSASDLVLEVKDLSVDYGWGENAVRAVNAVSLDVHRSQILGIAGESGSGKSTLVYGLTRLLRAPGVIAGGDVKLNLGKDTEGNAISIDILKASESELRKVRWSQVSIVLQSALSALNPVLRISKEFEEILKSHRSDMKKHERRARAVELLGMVGLEEDRLDRFPHELSGGQRQRIMIALALALDPQLVIMDEPTTALDVVTQREIINELADLRARFGFALIFITHDLSLLVELADEICVMYAGVIVERAPADALYSAPRHPYTLGLLNSAPPLHGARVELEGIPGSPPDLAEMPTGCSFHARCPYKMDRCVTQVPPLLATDSTGRVAACWLHSGDLGVTVPEQLGRTVSITPAPKFRAQPTPKEAS